MKKLFAPALLCALLLALCACGGGKTAEAAILPAESEIYTQEEIDEAIQVVSRYFQRRFDGCTLLAIGYAGDAATERVQNDPDSSMEGAMVLTSDFETDSTVEPGSIMPDATYHDWTWILGRDANGHWQYPYPYQK